MSLFSDNKYAKVSFGVLAFKETSEPEARKALLYAHGLILRLLKFQNNYFGLGLDAEIDTRWDEFPKIWKRESDEEPPVSPVGGL